MLDHFPILAFKFHRKLSFAGYDKVSRPVLITKSMTANYDRTIPCGNQPGNIFYHDRFARNSSIKNVADSAIRALPHLFEIKFLYPYLVRRNGGTFYSYTILFNSISRIYGYLVIGCIAVLNAKIIIFYIHVKIG